jgi:hypothetical protein
LPVVLFNPLFLPADPGMVPRWIKNNPSVKQKNEFFFSAGFATSNQDDRKIGDNCAGYGFQGQNTCLFDFVCNNNNKIFFQDF